MNKIIGLPIVALLGACTGNGGVMDSNTNAVEVEEKNPFEKTFDALVQDDSNFNWQDLMGTSSQSSQSAATLSAKEKAIAKLKASEANFVLYFDYDGSDINEAGTQEIIKHANFMRENPSINLRLEGHADERGTREYNLALGENRALSVKEVLGLYEGLEGRIEVVSFGEEKPIATAHDEASWQQNRRVEFIYE